MGPTELELPLPPMNLRFMNEDDERLVRTGNDLAALMYRHGLTSSSTLLDVGSCYGRLPLGLLSSTDFHGTYTGFDVVPKQVAWCRQNLTPVAPAFRFRHVDVRNDRYNPSGAVDPLELRFPARGSSIDAIALFSVFTHFYRPDIEHYLQEFRRVLKPGGVAVTTWLVFDEARLPATRSAASAYPMHHEIDERIRYSDPDDPLRAIAYEESLVRTLIADAGLEVVDLVRGTWCGDAPQPHGTFQDLVVIRRPVPRFHRVRAPLGRARRALRHRLRTGR